MFIQSATANVAQGPTTADFASAKATEKKFKQLHLKIDARFILLHCPVNCTPPSCERQNEAQGR